MGIGNKVVNFFRLEDEDPDRVEGIRDGPPIVPPQEWDNDLDGEGGARHGRSGGVPGAFQGRSDADPGRSEGFSGRSTHFSGRSTGERGLFRRLSRTVPKDDVDAMWWAKAARNVVWRGSYPLRIAIFAGGAVVVVAMAASLRPLREVLSCALLLISAFVALDPFQALCRRFAPQTRALLSGIPILTVPLLLWPSLPTAAALLAYSLIAVLVSALCNTEWLVAATYLSSGTIYDAMRRDTSGSAMKSWDAGGARECMTFCSEYGSFVTSPYLYRMAQGIYILAWLQGRDHEPEDEERSVYADGRVFRGATQKDYDELWRKVADLRGEMEDERAAARERYDELLEKCEKERAGRALAESLEKVAKDRLEALREEKDAEVEAILAGKEEELEALRTEKDGVIEALQAKIDADAPLVRLGKVRQEYDNGNRSARKIAAATGYPSTTVNNIIRKWKGEEKGGDANGDPDA